MQLDREQSGGNIIRSFSAGELHINDAVFTNHVIVSTDTIIENWSPQGIMNLSLADFSEVLSGAPEVIVFGTGITQTFPPGALVTDILRQGIGFEIMDTAAACRTFNVLTTERRNVIAALLVR
ncbi:MAG: MTH938/NDUFAF3 family protein [Gammaproteobacteria bacterium]|jgi:uncharacterized protein|nr:hypothetical protein [Chromatiales bacterium]MDP7296208.1 MTH938/NDUFAF3 family protein [Gammaproteobacteria bacterium]MDP7418943.1 MTH938/NDUFAF3 family protein [Gammaproteobacteria bacterium]MDP7659803.1 MTH938/NDUFAF3 family protein [Gammaproteobacteria bacterium]HJP39131.1 MTH938/NDUFAF3 family protein [Gammaproteobacteria bacterium]